MYLNKLYLTLNKLYCAKMLLHMAHKFSFMYQYKNIRNQVIIIKENFHIVTSRARKHNLKDKQ